MKKLKLVAAMVALGFAVGAVQAQVERVGKPINPSSEKKSEKAPATPPKVERIN